MIFVCLTTPAFYNIILVFTKEAVESTWKWGEHDLPTVAKYTFLGIDFVSNGAWDGHIKKVLDCGRKKVNQLHSVIYQ